MTPAAGRRLHACWRPVGTRGYLAEQGVEVELVKKVLEGRPHIVDAMKNGEVQLVFNTTEGKQSLEDSFEIRRTALMMKVPYYTTSAGALAAAQAISGAPAEAPSRSGRCRVTSNASSFSPCGRRWPEGPDEGAEDAEPPRSAERPVAAVSVWSERGHALVRVPRSWRRASGWGHARVHVPGSGGVYF